MNNLNTVVENIKRGDTNGWSVVYQTYYNRLYRHALSLTNNDPQNAQDAVQGAFARAMSDNRILTLKDNERLFQWLSTFVLNEVRPMWRKQEKFMAFSTAEDYENTLDSIADDDICIPEDYAMDEAFKRRMKKAVESLTSKQRIVVQMYYYEGKTIPQIAADMKLSESSVKTHLTAARAKLKKYIENYEKSGNKFRVVVPIPFLFNKEMPKGIYTAGVKTAGTVMATRVLSGVLAGLLAANAAYGGLYAAGVVDLNNMTTAESETDRRTESVITDKTASDTADTKDKNADESAVSADPDVFGVNAFESGSMEYTNGYYSFKLPANYFIQSESNDEVGIMLNNMVFIMLWGDETSGGKTISMGISRTEGHANNRDLNAIKAELSEKYSKEINSPILHEFEFKSPDVLLVTSYSNPDYKSDGTSKTRLNPEEDPNYNTYVYTSKGFYIRISVNFGEAVDDETLPILKSIELNHDNFDKLSEKITPKLIEKLSNFTVTYEDYDNTPHQMSEVLGKYFEGNISYYISKDNASDDYSYLNASGIHDGVECTLSWQITNPDQNYVHRLNDIDHDVQEYRGNVIQYYPFEYTNDMIDDITISSKERNQYDEDIMYWYLDRPYQLDYDKSPNSALFDTSDIKDFEFKTRAAEIRHRNFIYHTEVKYKGEGSVSFKGDNDHQRLSNSSFWVYYDSDEFKNYLTTQSRQDIIKLHHDNMKYKQFESCQSMTDDDYRNLKKGDNVCLYYKYGVEIYDLYIENKSN